MNFVTIVLPTLSKDAVSEMLRELTKRITEVTGEQSGWGLGGEHGYGEDFENEVFMMHRYCWCDLDNCPWCEGRAPNFRHLTSGAEISWYKYIGRGMEVDKADWYRIFSECFASLDGKPEDQCPKGALGL